jgi:hypothetical protein
MFVGDVNNGNIYHFDLNKFLHKDSYLVNNHIGIYSQVGIHEQTKQDILFLINWTLEGCTTYVRNTFVSS